MDIKNNFVLKNQICLFVFQKLLSIARHPFSSPIKIEPNKTLDSKKLHSLEFICLSP